MSSDLIVLTRREADNQALAAQLEAQGLRCLSYPCLATRTCLPDADTLSSLSAEAPLAAMAFPSRAAVEGLYDQPALLEQLRWNDGPLLAAVGPATAKLLTARDRAPDLIANPATGAALATGLADLLPAGSRVLIPGGDKQRPELPEGLRAANLVPIFLQVYSHEPLVHEPLPPRAPAAIFCASPSAAQTFLHTNPDLATAPFIAIGPTTEQALRDLGATEITRASDTTPKALVDAILSALRKRD